MTKGQNDLSLQAKLGTSYWEKRWLHTIYNHVVATEPSFRVHYTWFYFMCIFQDMSCIAHIETKFLMGQ